MRTLWALFTTTNTTSGLYPAGAPGSAEHASERQAEKGPGHGGLNYLLPTATTGHDTACLPRRDAKEGVREWVNAAAAAMDAVCIPKVRRSMWCA